MTLHLIPKRNAKEGGTSPGQRFTGPPGRYVFDYTGDIWQREKLAILNFVRVRERAGLTEKFEGYGSTFHKVHFHLFRKFFLTKGSDVDGGARRPRPDRALVLHGHLLPQV